MVIFRGVRDRFAQTKRNNSRRAKNVHRGGGKRAFYWLSAISGGSCSAGIGVKMKEKGLFLANKRSYMKTKRGEERSHALFQPASAAGNLLTPVLNCYIVVSR